MEYKSIDGNVYSRYALSPPIVNSDLAFRYGVKVPCMVEPGQFTGLEVGRNVKLRLVVDRGTRKITCHAKIDWLRKDESTDQYYVGFGQLSLTDDEFQVLERNFVEKTDKVLEFGLSVRNKAREAEPVVISDTAREITRHKAVKFPVSVIEAIDEKRGKIRFSEFVVNAVKEYLKR